MKLMPSLNNYLCKLEAPVETAQQQKYKLIIESVILFIRILKFTSTAHGKLINRFVYHNIGHYILHV